MSGAFDKGEVGAAMGARLAYEERRNDLTPLDDRGDVCPPRRPHPERLRNPHFGISGEHPRERVTRHPPHKTGVVDHGDAQLVDEGLGDGQRSAVGVGVADGVEDELHRRDYDVVSGHTTDDE